MAEQRDVQALAATVLRGLLITGDESVANHEARAALDGLVALLNKQEEALREACEELGYQRHVREGDYGRPHDSEVDEIMEEFLPALSPPPVASGETAEEAQFTPEAWEKLTQQHQAFLARRSVASGENA